MENNGVHPKNCRCIFCNEIRVAKNGVGTLIRRIMKPKEDRAPKLRVEEPERYVCPVCLEEQLIYDEEIRMFTCRKCKEEFILAKVN